jgi:hypothetical protein
MTFHLSTTRTLRKPNLLIFFIINNPTSISPFMTALKASLYQSPPVDQKLVVVLFKKSLVNYFLYKT